MATEDKANRQFKRTYELVIGDPSNSKGLKITGDEAKNEGLQITFNIKKHVDNKEQSNTCTLNLYNLSEDSIKYIEQDAMAVIFKVGYNGDNKVLFTGITKEVDTDHRSSNNDRKTTIKCVPSDSFTYQPKISNTFPEGTTPRQVIDYLVGESTGISKSSFNSDNIDQEFPFGYTVEGSVKSVLDELSRDYRFQYRLDGGSISINDYNRYQSPNSSSKATVISPTTGLIGVPDYASADGKRVKDDIVKKNGIKFTALINPLLSPGGAVSLKNTRIEGIYRINSASFGGDWRGNKWEVTCHCSKLPAQEAE